MAEPVNFSWNPTAHSQVFLGPQDTHNRNEMHRFCRWKVSILFILCFLYNTPNCHVSSGHRTGRGLFSFQLQWKEMPKNVPTTTQLHSSHTLVSSVQFSSMAQSCLTLCNPMNRSTPGLPVHHHLPEFTQIQVHRVSDAIQPSHPLSSPSPPSPNPSQHQSLFQWVNTSHEVAKVLEFQL